MSDARNIAILGSTGSVGTQTLQIVRGLADRFSVVALSAGKNVELLSEQIEEFQPLYVGIADYENAGLLKEKFPDIMIFSGDDALIKLASFSDIHIVVNAIVGSAGLLTSWYAVNSGKRLCTANKESLVMAGELLTATAEHTGASIFPIDSEHSALWQAMLAGKRAEIKRLILTASGGPFWDKDIDFSQITPQQALNHPNWTMGKKITIDSATMMNKALEIIEAHWLFDIPPEQIEVVIHPQSIVHSIVEFIDGSQIAQLSLPDMRLPIQYAITYPERLASPIPTLELSEINKLEFFTPDEEKFPALKLAYRVLEMGGTAPTILNTVNEVAVHMFLQGKLMFSQIIPIVEQALQEISIKPIDSIETVFEADKISKKWMKKWTGKK